MKGLVRVLLLVALVLADKLVDWIMVVAAAYLICKCFQLDFSPLKATGIWIALETIKVMFGGMGSHG